jgi:hypothetical protein
MLLRELLKEDEETKQAIIAKISGLQADNEQDAEILDRIFRTLHNDDISGKIAQAFGPPTEDDTFQLEPLLKTLTQIIFHAGVNYKSLSTFLSKLETSLAVTKQQHEYFNLWQH